MGRELVMARFRKKAAVIDAVQWLGQQEALDFFTDHKVAVEQDHNALILATAEGPQRARVGDWIIRGANGDVFPCKPDVFAALYDPE